MLDGVDALQGNNRVLWRVQAIHATPPLDREVCIA